ncbi:hypothetical protein MKZ38_005569 [Zalerion maritima]|uniref:BRCT domain-containing protein n=1 Tax=Zalerion maritima TaxID=339359 RepID=A0AAD5WP78_9PEZI|nr:hypothetical protein MKZ38_005569 [Zalerion maritima]
MDSSSKPTRAAEPRQQVFDPWVSVAAGHQVAETSVGTRWRVARANKLAGQFLGGNGGGERQYDSVGPGTQHYDERLGGIVTPEVRSRATRSVKDLLMQPGLMKEDVLKPKVSAFYSPREKEPSDKSKDTAASAKVGDDPPSSISDVGITAEDILSLTRAAEDEKTQEAKAARQEAADAGKRIFEGVNVYVNGSTFPLVSDHKLKHLMAEHGGSVSLHLGRRTVTHVIIGRPVGRAGFGGGLAGGKLEKEIRKSGGVSVKFVGVEWILDSIKAGSRLPEARFATLKMARKGQRSIYDQFKK